MIEDEICSFVGEDSLELNCFEEIKQRVDE